MADVCKPTLKLLADLVLWFFSLDDPPLRFAHDLRIQSKLSQAEETLQLQSEYLCLNTVAEHVAALCASISTYLDALTQYSLKYLEHFRFVDVAFVFAQDDNSVIG